MGFRKECIDCSRSTRQLGKMRCMELFSDCHLRCSFSSLPFSHSHFSFPIRWMGQTTTAVGSTSKQWNSTEHSRAARQGVRIVAGGRPHSHCGDSRAPRLDLGSALHAACHSTQRIVSQVPGTKLIPLHPLITMCSTLFVCSACDKHRHDKWRRAVTCTPSVVLKGALPLSTLTRLPRHRQRRYCHCTAQLLTNKPRFVLICSLDLFYGQYAFKCHRQRNEEGKEVVHPVHSMAYNSLGTFATGLKLCVVILSMMYSPTRSPPCLFPCAGGGDGFIYFWDPAAKKRLMSAGPYPTSIASMSFNADASKLAIASSYAFEQGQKE